MTRIHLYALSLISIILLPSPSNAADLYSVDSLRVICGTENEENDGLCKIYLHGVVETWMLKDIVSVDPYVYENQNSAQVFCETINRVSDDEWLLVVKSNLEEMEDGLAAIAVMEILSAQFCQ